MTSTVTARAMRARYADAAATTAPPSRVLTMLYERLSRDLAEAEDALCSGRAHSAHEALVHAQEIVSELHSALDTDGWDGGPGLAQLYRFLVQELIGANVEKDAARVRACRAIVDPLCDAWNDAAGELSP